MRIMRHSARLEGKKIQRRLSWAGTSRCCKLERRKWCLGRRKQTSRSQSYPRWTSRKKYFQPKRSTRPLPSNPSNTPMPPIHTPAPQFRFMALIESKVNASSIVNWVLSEKVYLSVEELLALAPKVRKHFKESMTTKKLLALPARAQAMVAHMVSTFSMGMDHEHLMAEPALLLWTIEVTLDGKITVTGIIDRNCQGIIICRDIWEKLGTPMKHEQVMFMESANGQANTTMGTIPSICFSVGEVSLYCLVQVV